MTRWLLLLTLAVGALNAQSLPTVFGEVRGPSSKADARGTAKALTSERVKLNRELFDATSSARFEQAVRLGKSPKMQLNLAPDANWTLALDNTQIWNNGETVTWTGHLDGEQTGSFSLAVTGEIVSGHVAAMSGRVFEISGDASGVVLQEIDPKSIQWLCDAKPDETFVMPKEQGSKDAEVLPDPRNVGPAVVVDVLVAYTTQAAAAAGGEATMLTQIREAVAYTNQAYANNGLLFRINLVDTRQVTMAEDGTCATPLNRLTGTSDGVIDDIHARRDAVGADLVALFISRGDCGGLAWVMNQNSTSFAPRGFSVTLSTSPTFWRNISFAHELGHNMGAMHDRSNSNNPGLFPYSYGYQSFEATPYFRDIMAYECSGGIRCPNVQLFSSPENTVSGRPIGRPASAFDSADVRTTFANSIGNVSNFRPSRALPGGTLTLAPSTVTVPPTGGTNLSINVTTAGAWQVITNAPWITLQNTSGSGNGTIRFNVAANTLSETRRGSIQVGSTTAIVEQAAGLPCAVTPIELGGNVAGSLTAQSCSSPIRGNTRAVRYSFFGTQGQQVAIGTTSTAFDTYLYLLGPGGNVVQENDDVPGSLNSRIPPTGFYALPTTGTYTIEVTTFSANESGAFTLSTATPTCTYSLNPTSLNIASGESASSFTVQTQAGCSWSASSSTPWISITNNSSNSGPGDVGLRIAANTTAATRSGTVRVGAQTLTVNQAAPAGCTSATLTPGAVANGTLSTGQTCRSAYRGANTLAARYQFNGSAGQQIRLLLESPTLDTYLYLIGPEGNIIAEDDDSAGNLNSVIPATGNFTLPATGLYRVEATTFDENAAGTFTLRLTANTVNNFGGTLTSGIPRTLQLPAVQNPLLFNDEPNLLRIDVPAGATRLEVRLTTATAGADVDLHVRYGTAPQVSGGSVVADASGVGLTGEEVVVITPQSSPALRAGTYVIALAVFTPGVAVSSTVTATVTGGGSGGGTGGSAPTISAVLNGGSFGPAIAPGSWATIFGSNLAPTGANRIWRDSEIINGVLPTILEGTRVTVGGLAAAVYFVFPQQVNFQVPASLPPGPALVQITTPNGTASRTIQIESIAPGLFEVGQASGRKFAVVQDAQSRLIAPAAIVPGARTSARRGEVIVLYATGLGQTLPVHSSGVVISGALPLPVATTATIGGVNAPVQFAGLIGAGLYQVNLQVPNVPLGDQAIVITVGGRQSATDVFVPVSQ